MQKAIASLLALPFIVGGSDKMRKMRQAFEKKGLGSYFNTISFARKMENFDFSHNLSICVIVKNETDYMPEWIEYHKMMGVEKFYIYNNDSTDDIEGCLDRYIKCGLVELINFSGKGMQRAAYNDAIERSKDKTKWLAFIDIDEFIVPLKHANIPEFLSEFKDKDISQIVMFWLTYGSSGYIHKPEGLVIENFTHHAKEPEHTVKSIVKPYKTLLADVHSSSVLGKTVDERQNPFSKHNATIENIRINHYYGKSKDEFLIKRAKGRVDINTTTFRELSEFENHDKNDIKDEVMEKFVPAIKEALKS